MLNIHNIPKPVYRAYQLLARSGDLRYLVNGSHPTLGVFATNSNQTSTEYLVFVYNHNLPGFPINNESLSVTINGVSDPHSINATIERIDEEHSNAPGVWRAMGSPEYLNSTQVKALKESSQLEAQPLKSSSIGKSSVTYTIDIPANAVALITLT